MNSTDGSVSSSRSSSGGTAGATRRRATALLFATVATLALAACGGGGGGGSTPPPAPTPVSITAANQDQVAAATVNVFVGFGGVATAIPLAQADRVVAAGKTTVELGAVTLPAEPAVGALLLRLGKQAMLAPMAQLEVARAAKAAGVVRPQAVISDSRACPGGGSVSLSLNDVDNNLAASAGDSLTLAFNQCRDGTDLIDGSMTLAFNRVQRGAGSLDLSATLSFGSLTAATSEGSAILNGAVTMSLAVAGSVTTSELLIGPNGLTSAVTSLSPSYSETLTLSAGFSIRETHDAAAVAPGTNVAGLSSMQANGSITSTRLNGTLSIATVTPVQTWDANLYPHAGQVIVTGANGSRLRITAIDAVNVRLELDANGDGTYETVTVRRWSEIL